MNTLAEKELEVEVSRLKHSILESELKKIKKLEEVKRIDESITKFREVLANKERTK